MIKYKFCKNPRCYDSEDVKFGLCNSCRLAGGWGAGLAFFAGAVLKFAGVLLIVLMISACGKDKNPFGPSHQCAHYFEGEWHEYNCHSDHHHRHGDKTKTAS